METGYDFGVLVALRTVGLVKEAAFGDIARKVLAHPATIGAGLGAAGGALQGGDTSIGERMLRNAGAGALIGAGIKYLPKYTGKLMPKGHALAKDMPWLAPSLLAPAITTPSATASK